MPPSATLRARQPLLDLLEAAHLLGCSERYLRRLVAERRIPFLRLGGTKLRFDPEDLEAWLLSQRVEARPRRHGP